MQEDWKKKLKKMKKGFPIMNPKPVQKVKCRPSQEETRISNNLIRRRVRK